MKFPCCNKELPARLNGVFRVKCPCGKLHYPQHLLEQQSKRSIMISDKKYIEMCGKADEIQNCCSFERGDLYVNKDYSFGLGELEEISINCYCRRDIFNNIDKYIWIPYQVQLQEIYCTEYPFTLEHFILFVKKEDKYFEIFKSMEQLWLAFVMKEKYGKEWNGEDWANKDGKE